MRTTKLVVLLLFLCSSLRAQSELVVPVAGDVAGARGTHFRTDVTVRNRRDVPQDVQLEFLPTGPEFRTTLGAHETATFEDIVAGKFQTTGIGAIVIKTMRGDANDAAGQLTAAYRIYTTTPRGAGTMSQSSNAIDLSRASDQTSKMALAAGLEQDSAFRTNVGVFNGDADRARDFRVTATGNHGSATMILTVQPNSTAQAPLPPVDLGHATVKFELLDDPPAAWVAYASTIDNQSGDSWMTTAVPFPTNDHHPAVSLMFPAGDISGANGTHFQTDIDITNHRDVEETVWIGLYDGFFYGDPGVETEITIPPLSTRTFNNVAGELLQSPGELGAVIINTLDYPQRADLGASLTATYRIWTPTPDGGSMSYTSEAVDLQHLPPSEQERVAIGVRLDSNFRCNVGIANDSYYGGSFRITAKSASGSVTITVGVNGYSLAQFPLPDADLGYVTVTVTPIGGPFSLDRWTAYATSVDNRTGDSWLQNADPK